MKKTDDAVLLEYLKSAWRAQYGVPPGLFETDLERLAVVFSRQTSSQRIRTLAKGLPPVPENRPWIPERLYLEIDDRRGFVTPEGRAFIESEGSESRSAEIAAKLVDFYGADRRAWIRKETGGGTPTLQSLGFALFLLLNGNVGVESALQLPAEPREEESLAPRVMAVADAFSKALGGSSIQPRELSRLSGNWIVTEAGKRLSRYLTLERQKKGFARTYISVGAEPGLEAAIAASAGERGIDPDSLDRALRSALSNYEEARPILVARGLAKRPITEAREVTGRIVDALQAEAYLP